MPSSEARISANRANALRSTGPKTAEGKERSRQNAVKHGLTGNGIALPDEDGAVVEERFDSLREQFDPRTPMGGILVKRVAMLSVRLDRSYRREAGATAARVLGAGDAFDDARKAEAENLLRRIAAEPVTNHRRLMATPEGVDALIQEWEKMKVDLEHPHGTRWIWTHYHQADYMHGNLSTNIDQSDYMCWTLALMGDNKHIKPEHFQGLNEQARHQYILERLAELVDADLARLREHRATMDTKAVDALREHAAAIALFDGSKEAVLARKYEAATERGIYRALRELRQVEAEADATLPDPAEIEPEPIDPPGTLASFFPPSETASDPVPRTGRRRGRSAGSPSGTAEMVPMTIGRAPSGPA